MWVIKNKNLFFIFSGTLVVLSIVLIVTRGLNVSIDFTGGSAVEITYEGERPDITQVRQALTENSLGDVTVRPFGEKSYFFQTQSTQETIHEAIYTVLAAQNPEQALTKGEPHIIGPSIGAELKNKAIFAIITVLLGIILFVAYAFRHGSEKISSWKFGVIAIIALAHDIIIPTGVAAIFGLEVGSLFVIALLAILGLSVNDTIVVFDRVRENLRLKISHNFAELVGKSLDQTYGRSLNTSLTTLFVLLTLYFIGPVTIQDFALVLAVGLLVGTYSSIFLASPLLVEAEKMQTNKRKKAKKA